MASAANGARQSITDLVKYGLRILEDTHGRDAHTVLETVKEITNRVADREDNTGTNNGKSAASPEIKNVAFELRSLATRLQEVLTTPTPTITLANNEAIGQIQNVMAPSTQNVISRLKIVPRTVSTSPANITNPGPVATPVNPTQLALTNSLAAPAPAPAPPAAAAKTFERQTQRIRNLSLAEIKKEINYREKEGKIKRRLNTNTKNTNTNTKKFNTSLNRLKTHRNKRTALIPELASQTVYPVSNRSQQRTTRRITR